MEEGDFVAARSKNRQDPRQWKPKGFRYDVERISKPVTLILSRVGKRLPDSGRPFESGGCQPACRRGRNDGNPMVLIQILDVKFLPAVIYFDRRNWNVL